MAKKPDLEKTTPASILQARWVFHPNQKNQRWLWIVGGIFFVLLMVALGGFLGYQDGVGRRLANENEQRLARATTQFQLGLVDLQEKRYELARQRFEYVIRLDPNFPGALDKLTEAMLASSEIATPTPQPTPTEFIMTATPDTRGEEAIFNQVRQELAGEQWAQALVSLDALRQLNIKYRTVEVDGFYYIALRHRGVQMILIEGNLEMGMYFLALTERFGPLDTEADGYRNWARLYVTGASYWGIDWLKVIDYFSQIYEALPNLRDGSGMTAVERYRQALIAYGDLLSQSGDYCQAEEYYRAAYDINQDSLVEPTLSWLSEKCIESQATDTPPPTETPTPTPTGSGITTPEPGTTPIPTETPTPTPVGDKR